MYPGKITRLGGPETVATTTTISPTSDLVMLTGTTSIETILPPFLGVAPGVMFFVPVTDTVSTVTTGNIAIAVTMALKRVTVMVYNQVTNKWYPGAIS